MAKPFADWEETATELGAPCYSFYKIIEYLRPEIVKGKVTASEAEQVFQAIQQRWEDHRDARIEAANKAHAIFALWVQLQKDVTTGQDVVEAAATPAPPLNSLFSAFFSRGQAEDDEEEYRERSQPGREHLRTLACAMDPLNEYLNEDVIVRAKYNSTVKRFWEDGICPEVARLQLLIKDRAA